MQKDEVQFIELASRLGGVCRVHNPWPEAGANVYRKGKKAEHLVGPTLSLATAKGERIILVRFGSSVYSESRMRRR